jgi:hypothetical protein
MRSGNARYSAWANVCGEDAGRFGTAPPTFGQCSESQLQASDRSWSRSPVDGLLLEEDSLSLFILILGWLLVCPGHERRVGLMT